MFYVPMASEWDEEVEEEYEEEEEKEDEENGIIKVQSGQFWDTMGSFPPDGLT